MQPEAPNQFEEEEEDDEEGAAMNELLRTYYNEMQEDEPNSSDTRTPKKKDGKDHIYADQLREEENIDSPYFDATMFVQKKLGSHPIKELVDYNNDLNGEVKALDSDMQMLVYENYNKFISATDTIRNMKAQVESMEEEMDRLFQNMEDINTSCTAIEATFSPNRKQIEKLVGVRRLLKRLEFLFELPKRLRDSINMGAHAQAVKYFKISTGILEQYKHIQSFQNIQTESEQIVSGLKNKLRYVVQDPSITTSHQLETAALLRDLNDPPEHLWHDILRTRKEGLLQLIQTALDYVEPEEIERHNKLSISSEHESKDGSIPDLEHVPEPDSQSKSDQDDTSGTKSANPFDDLPPLEPSDTNPFDGPVKSSSSNPFDNSSPSNPFEESANPFAESPNPFASPEQKAAVPDPKPKPHQESVSGHQEAESHQIQHEPEPPLKRTIARLHDFFILAFEEFADAYYNTFIKPYLDSSETDEEGRQIHEKATYALTSFTRGLFTEYFTVVRTTLQEQESVPVLNDEISAFYEGLRKPSILVPGARLRDTAVEQIEGIINYCVGSVFRKAKNIIVELFTGVDEKITKWDEAGYFMPRPRRGSKADVHRKEVNIPRQVSNTTRSIHEIIEAQIGSLRTLIADETCLIKRLDIPFTELVQSQTIKLLKDLCAILRRGALTENMGPVHVMEDEKQWNDEDAPTTMHLLLRSQICASMNSSSVPNVLSHFSQLFSLDRRAKRSLEREEKPKILLTCKDSAQVLLQGFVEIHGNKIMDRFTVGLLSQTDEDEGGEQKHVYQEDRSGDGSEDVAANAAEDAVEDTTEDTAVDAAEDAVEDTVEGTAEGGGDFPLEASQDSSATPSRFIQDIMQDLLMIDVELQQIFTNPVESFVRPPAKHWGGTRNREYIDRDRLFAKKVVIFGHVQRNRTSPILGVLKIALKGFTEILRTYTITKAQFQQIQVDMHAMRCIIPSHLSNADFGELESLIDDVISCALDRCTTAEPLLDFDIVESSCEGLSLKFT